MSIIMLTKQGCGSCNNLKNFMNTGRMKSYKPQIVETILDVKEPERYKELRESSGAMSLPILINAEDGTLFDSGFNAERLKQKFVTKYGNPTDEPVVDADLFAKL